MVIRRARFLAIAAAALGAGACSGAGDPAKPSPSTSFRAATFNTGLALGYEDYVSEREPASVAALANAAKERHLDALCLQEIWDPEHVEALGAALASELPNRVWHEPEPGPATCGSTELDPVMSCLDKSCPAKLGGDLVSCAVQSCMPELGALSAGCLACVQTGANKGQTPSAITDLCAGGAAGSSNATPALFGGAFDAALFTRQPILESDARTTDSYLVRNAYLYAKVQAKVPTHVFCVHLGSSIPGFEYEGPYASWEGENEHQIQELIAFVNEKAADGNPVVVLGDFNVGPAIDSVEPKITGELVPSYAKLMEGGFDEPFVSQSDVACTLCPETGYSSRRLVDHVLVRNFGGAASVARFMTENVSIQVDGKPVETTLSDHFGLVATLSGGGM